MIIVIPQLVVRIAPEFYKDEKMGKMVYHLFPFIYSLSHHQYLQTQ